MRARRGLRRHARLVGGGARLVVLVAAEAAEQALLQALEQLEVALGDLVDQRPRRLPDQVADQAAQLALLLVEQRDAALEVAADVALQRIAVEADDLGEQLRGEDR